VAAGGSVTAGEGIEHGGPAGARQADETELHARTPSLLKGCQPAL
jgi:hypothetical protein